LPAASGKKREMMEHIHIQMDSHGRLAALNGMISSTTEFHNHFAVVARRYPWRGSLISVGNADHDEQAGRYGRLNLPYGQSKLKSEKQNYSLIDLCLNDSYRN